MTVNDTETRRSEKWRSNKNEIEDSGGDWRQHRIQSLNSINLNYLRMAASVVGIDPVVTKEELIECLVDAGCFLGPIGDETIYQEQDGKAIPLIGKRGVLGMTSWKRLRDAESRDVETSDANE